jgi:hypothetical protein
MTNLQDKDPSPTVDAHPLCDTKAAARILGMSPSWLNHDRMKLPPEIPFVRVGDRSVRYRLVDLLAYAERKIEKPIIPDWLAKPSKSL